MLLHAYKNWKQRKIYVRNKKNTISEKFFNLRKI